jgi:hypothetical protein
MAIKLGDTMSLLRSMGHATEVDLGKAEANLHDVASSPARQVIVPEWIQAPISPVREQLEELTLKVVELGQEVLVIKQGMMQIEQKLVDVQVVFMPGRKCASQSYLENNESPTKGRVIDRRTVSQNIGRDWMHVRERPERHHQILHE